MKVKKIISVFAVCVLSIATFSMAAMAEFPTPFATGYQYATYDVDGYGDTWIGKDETYAWVLDSESTVFNLSIKATQASVVTARLYQQRDYSIDPLVITIPKFQGSNGAWTRSSPFTVNSDYTYYATVTGESSLGTWGNVSVQGV